MEEQVLNAEEIKSRLQNQSVSIDNEILFVVEGDVLLDEDQLMIYAEQQVALQEARFARQKQADFGMAEISRQGAAELVGILEAGKIVRWQQGLILTYCVLKNTFVNEERYQTVSENMAKATADWENTCGVKFEHRRELDNSSTTTPEGVIFPVRELNANGKFIASAFFPNDPQHRRKILIDPSYFITDFDRVGVLRHELGHVLGFRHEHIRSGAPADCPDEEATEDNTIDLTLYDPKSCMHYFCGGVGSKDLSITPVDIAGSQKLYGQPLDLFVETS